MKKQLVFVGAGHAHLYCLNNLNKFQSLGVEITVINPYEFHYYSGMGPGLLSGIYSPDECRFFISKIVQENVARFIQDSVIKINPNDKKLFLESGNEIPYDIVSFNVGSIIDLGKINNINSNLIPIKPIRNLFNMREKILNFNNLKKICVIGGGAAGVEIAANTWKLFESNKINAEVILISSGLILSRYPEKAREYALDSLKNRKIKVLEHSIVTKISENKISLDDGNILESDIVFLATGIQPTDIFQNSGLALATDASFIVNSYLQSLKYDNIFGGGDCISLENEKLEKIGVYAVRQNKILFNNIFNYIDKGELKEFKPQSKYLLILNMGDGLGIAWKGNKVVQGKLLFRLKNFIDKRFMKRFQ